MQILDFFYFQLLNITQFLIKTCKFHTKMVIDGDCTTDQISHKDGTK